MICGDFSTHTPTHLSIQWIQLFAIEISTFSMCVHAWTNHPHTSHTVLTHPVEAAFAIEICMFSMCVHICVCMGHPSIQPQTHSPTHVGCQITKYRISFESIEMNKFCLKFIYDLSRLFVYGEFIFIVLE